MKTYQTLNLAAITVDGLTWSTQVYGESVEVVQMATDALIARTVHGLDPQDDWNAQLLVATIAWPMGTQVFSADNLQALVNGYAVRFQAAR